MKKRRFQKSVTVALILAFLCIGSFRPCAQVTLTGPACILPGSPYQYVLNGNWSSGSTVRVCITGGKLLDSTLCTADTGVVSSVLVVWNDNSVHKLDVTSSLGATSLIVTQTSELNPGQILENDRFRMYDSTHTMYTFHCSQPSGGTCEPVYTYQWQQSNNGINWSDIPGATNTDLLFIGSVQVTTFLRRVTTETVSHTVGYSDNALLIVQF